MQIFLGVLLIAGLILLFLAWIRARKNYERSLNMVFLEVSVPLKDSKEDRERDSEQYGSGQGVKEVLNVMTHLFDSLHSVYQGELSNLIKGEDFFSCEYVLMEGSLRFFMVVPRHLKSLFEKQVTGSYPDVFIQQVEDYNIFQTGYQAIGSYIRFSKPSMFPIRTYQTLGTDPFNTIANTLSKLDLNEGAAIQIMLRPLGNGWQEKGRDAASELFQGKKKKKSFWSYLNVFAWVGMLIRLLVQGPDKEEFNAAADANQRTTPLMDEQVKSMETKNSQVGFHTVIRLVGSAKTAYRAGQIVGEIKDSFAQFNSPNANSFTRPKYYSRAGILRGFILRSIQTDWLQRILRPRPMILSSEEVASLFHFPNIKYNKSPVIKWQEFKIAPAPANLPSEGLFLGYNIYRGEKRKVHIKTDDRRRHFYLIGKSGTGKSTILSTMMKQDLANGHGLCLIDPHGDLVEGILPFIPRHRADDVILFDPGDLERPMGLNILEAEGKDQKEFMAQEALAIFIKMFGEEIMGPRLQHYFRNGCLTLMDDDDEGAVLIDLVRLFTDDSWQRYKSNKVKNPVVRAFWEKEMASTGAREKQEMIPYFAAKFGPFVTNAQIRNIIGQTKSGFDFRKVMDGKKILLCNLSKGKLGDLNAQLLGMVMVAKLQMSAMSRVDTPEHLRNDFYMYVDEFQNFVTDSFASILSEARKYRLDLTIAHQYISQITKLSGGGKGKQEDTTIRDAVFGNVGTMMCFKIGAQDAEYMAKEFSPVFSEQDLVNIANYQAYIKLNIDNATSRGFSMSTVYDPSKGDVQAAEAYKQLSRLKFAREKEFVEREIYRRVGTKLTKDEPKSADPEIPMPPRVLVLNFRRRVLLHHLLLFRLF
ncbi:type IV secretion system DNA-binding domain-containing protein [Candidatus Peregrinibacteria bacterium]|nr:MAG: type IV secretion system DNA-binding domain-containing protein [Candidatus Peregrinibacteria bacterium]